jgi:hypothetical protein
MACLATGCSRASVWRNTPAQDVSPPAGPHTHNASSRPLPSAPLRATDPQRQAAAGADVHAGRVHEHWLPGCGARPAAAVAAGVSVGARRRVYSMPGRTCVTAPVTAKWASLVTGRGAQAKHGTTSPSSFRQLLHGYKYTNHLDATALASASHAASPATSKQPPCTSPRPIITRPPLPRPAPGPAPPAPAGSPACRAAA